MPIVFGPDAVTIRSNIRETPARPVPAGVTRINVKMSRENWPAAGMNIELLVSYDGGTVFESPGPTHIAPFVPEPPRYTNVLEYPASIGVGWNQEIRQATHVKARTNNPGSNFQSTITIEAD